ncbi:MAG: hypothetical protein AABX89_02225 [Candidatus Thermoplasmatota archaeon]
MATKKGNPASGSDKSSEPDLAAIAAGFATEAAKLAKQFQATFEQVAEEAQYKFDQELAKALAKHPDLYAEVRKTLRQVKKTADEAAKAFGLKDKP